MYKSTIKENRIKIIMDIVSRHLSTHNYQVDVKSLDRKDVPKDYIKTFNVTKER
jgi:hypothetical protein